MKTTLSLAWLLCLFVCSLLAAEPQTVFSPDGPMTWQGGTYDKTLAAPGCQGSLRWAHGKAATLVLNGYPQNWQGDWNMLEVWLYSPEVMPKVRFLMFVGSEDPKSAGDDYYSEQIRLNFKGWKRFLFPLNKMFVSRQPVGFHHITALRFHASHYFNTLNPAVVVNIGSMKLIKGELPAPEKGPRLSDSDFYKLLDLSLLQLAAVKTAVEAENYKLANHELAEYYRQREMPRMARHWWERPNPDPETYNTAAADKILAHRLTSCEFEHQFGERIDWRANPTPLKYNEWTWQLNRHGFWSTLVDAYWRTGKEVYGKEFVKQMREWIEDCPVPLHGSGNHPGSTWRTITTGIRMLGIWPDCFFRMIGSPVFGDDDIVMMLKSFHEHAVHLRAFPSGGNWLCMEMNGLYHVGVLFPEFKLAKDWRDYAVNRLYKELDIQVYPDGAQKELAPGYHGVSLSNFIGLYKLAQLNHCDFPADYCQKLERMYTYYMNIMMPDNALPAVNDSLWGSCTGTLISGQKLFPNRTDFLYAATHGELGTQPSFTSVWMPYAGWGIMRSGWDDKALYMHFEVGPFGMGHQHEDKLSFIIAAHGRKLLTEGACYAYDSSAFRRYTLAAAAHNVINVDGQSQNRRKTSKYNIVDKPLSNRWYSSDSVDFLEGWYDEGFGDANDTTVTHYRAVLFVKPHYWLVFDVLSPKDDKAHDYESLFHLENTTAIADKRTSAVYGGDKDANIAILPFKSDGLSVDIVTGKATHPAQGWELRSGYYDKHPIPTACYHRQAAGQWLEPWLLYPLKTGEKQPPVSSLRMTSPSSLELKFADGRVHTVTLQLDSRGLAALSCMQQRSDGSFEAVTHIQ